MRRTRQVDASAGLGQPHLDTVPFEQRGHAHELVAAETALVLPTTIASKPRSGSASAANNRAACGRSAHSLSRVHPVSKYSATITP